MAEMTRLQRNTYRVWIAVGLIALVYAAWAVLSRPLAVVLAPLLFAMLIVYLLNPAVTWLADRGAPRVLATLAAYTACLLLLIGSAVVVLPALTTQVSNFAELAPELGQRFNQGANQALETVGIRVELGGQMSGEQIATEVGRFAEQNRPAVNAIIGGLAGLASGLLHVLLALIAGPFIAFYVLADFPRLSKLARHTVPPRHRKEVQAVVGKMSAVVGGYVRGQLLVALFVGVATSIGLAAIGLPFWLIIGIIAGITNLIPLIGPFVAGTIGVVIALLTGGWGLAVAVVIVMTVVQQLDGHLVSPLVVGRTVHLHPMVVLLALLVAATLYGIFGMLVAIPLVAAVKVAASHVWHTRVPWATEITAGFGGTVEDTGPIALDDVAAAERAEGEPKAGPPAVDAPAESGDGRREIADARTAPSSDLR